MIEDIEELRFQAQLHMFPDLKPLGKVEIAPGEVRTAQGVATQVAELAVL